MLETGKGHVFDLRKEYVNDQRYNMQWTGTASWHGLIDAPDYLPAGYVQKEEFGLPVAKMVARD